MTTGRWTGNSRGQNASRRRVRGRRLFAAVLVAVLLLSLFGCSRGGSDAAEKIADYGSDGSEFAKKLAAQCPRRVAFSDQEKKAADLILEQLRKEGFEPEQQFFSVKDASGHERRSSNIIVRIKGIGFRRSAKVPKNSGKPDRIQDRLLVIGAHYDTPSIAEKTDAEGKAIPIQADGINDNASGTAAVLVAARIMRDTVPGYDVTFVLFGAGTDNFVGAAHFFRSMSQEDRARLECMVNVGPIYAGDKIYAHAGQNSIRGEGYKDYARRRKLYQVTDIFFENLMRTRNGYAVFTNQASFTVPLKNGEKTIFREWTTKKSDHTPFDEAGIPVVFMESGEYNVKSLDEVGLESVNQQFKETDGRISGTNWDNSRRLGELFRAIAEIEVQQQIPIVGSPGETTRDGKAAGTDHTDPGMKPVDRLTQRVNNTAFILVNLARKGPLDYEFAA